MKRLAPPKTLPSLVLVAFFLVSVASAQTQYRITELVLPGGTNSSGASMNALGQVTGYSDTSTSGGKVHAFLYTHGRMIDLNPIFGSDSSSGAAINILGHIVVNTSSGSFLYRNGKVIDLKHTSARSINASDQVVGDGGWLYSHGTFTTIPTLVPQDDISSPFAINDQGHVTGMSHECCTQMPFYHGWSYFRGKLTALGTFPTSFGSAGTAINDRDQIAGFTTGPDAHAFRYFHGTMTDLSTLPGGTTSAAQGINNHGNVVGYSDTSAPYQRAFLYKGGKMIDLNTVIPSNSGWTLFQASAINDAGQITGWGLHNGAYLAYLLTPLPNVATLMSQVQSLVLPSAVSNSLLDKLKNAEDGGRGAVSCSGLDDYLAELRARSGSDLTATQATQLIATAHQVQAAESCK